MKTLSLALLVLAGFSAGACPDLTGSFTCTYEDGTSGPVVISQTTTNDITTYSINGTDFVADGQVISLPDEAGAKNQKISFSCEGTPSKYKDSFSADVYEAGVFQGTYVSDYFFSKDATGNLVVEDTGTFSGPGFEVPWATTMTCATAL